MTREQVYATRFLGISLELRLLLAAVLLGALLGAVFDIFRALRLTFRHPAPAVFVEDFVFMFIGGIAFYSFCTELCRGQMRFFVLIGMIIGFTCYIFTLGRLFCKAFAAIVKFVKKVFSLLGKVIKKGIGILCGLPFFEAKGEKVEENPCTDGEF